MQYAINVMFDESPANPFTDWDCEPPILVLRSSGIGRYDFDSYGVPEECPDLNEKVVHEHWRAILLDATEYPPTWRGLMQFARDNADRWHPLVDALAETMQEYVDDLGVFDKMEALVEVYGWLGEPAYTAATCGYSQGDYAEVLVVPTREWCKKMGVDPRGWAGKDFQEVVKLYGAWAWGDVYGYAITRIDEEDEDVEPCDYVEGVPVFRFDYGKHPQGEYLDSCWGFYGSDDEASGLYECAVNVVRCLQVADAKEAAERAEWEARDVQTVA